MGEYRAIAGRKDGGHLQLINSRLTSTDLEDSAMEPNPLSRLEAAAQQGSGHLTGGDVSSRHHSELVGGQRHDPLFTIYSHLPDSPRSAHSCSCGDFAEVCDICVSPAHIDVAHLR